MRMVFDDEIVIGCLLFYYCYDKDNDDNNDNVNDDNNDNDNDDNDDNVSGPGEQWDFGDGWSWWWDFFKWIK